MTEGVKLPCVPVNAPPYLSTLIAESRIDLRTKKIDDGVAIVVLIGGGREDPVQARLGTVGGTNKSEPAFDISTGTNKDAGPNVCEGQEHNPVGTDNTAKKLGPTAGGGKGGLSLVVTLGRGALNMLRGKFDRRCEIFALKAKPH